MVCRLVLVSALCVLTATPLRAATDATTYARALRAFAPALDVAAAQRWAACVIDAADRARVDARLIVALVAVESSWDAGARSTAGARGLGQLMPSTAAQLRVDAADPEANLRGTAAYLGALVARYAGYPPAERYRRAIAAYNAGPAAVDRFDGVPPFAETRDYVSRVIALWRRLVPAERLRRLVRRGRIVRVAGAPVPAIVPARIARRAAVGGAVGRGRVVKLMSGRQVGPRRDRVLGRPFHLADKLVGRALDVTHEAPDLLGHFGELVRAEEHQGGGAEDGHIRNREHSVGFLPGAG
jgi:hypothetical protein